MASHAIVVYGASGHTGGFVVRELARRGFTPIRAGRTSGAGRAVDRIADISHAHELDRMLVGAAAVINCAGPFLETARPLALAALRARIHYLDVTAEQAAARETLADLADAARARDVCVIPAAGFFGGLADLLATAALAPATTADSIDIRIALDHWWPTPGTRETGRRNTVPRVVVADGALVTLPSPAPMSRWRFPSPFDEQDMVEVPLSEIITLHQHLSAREIHTHVNTAPLAELGAPTTPPPTATDESGRSAQRFVVEAITGAGDQHRITRASGRDIYAITAPLVVEAVARILEGRVHRRGTGVLGELFDAASFLAALPLDVDGIATAR